MKYRLAWIFTHKKCLFNDIYLNKTYKVTAVIQKVLVTIKKKGLFLFLLLKRFQGDKDFPQVFEQPPAVEPSEWVERRVAAVA